MALPKYAMNQASFPEAYERELAAPLFRPFAEAALEAIEFRPGDRLLDIACGTGVVARAAAEQAGSTAGIAGVDVSPDMLEVAKRTSPKIDWRVGDAIALPIEDQQFDVIVCHQGLQFVQNKTAAVAEMLRVLRHDGRLAVATWRSDKKIPFFGELRAIAESRLGPIADQRYGFGDGRELETLIRDTGFRSVESQIVSRVVRFDDGEPLLRMNAMALVGMSADGMALQDEARSRVLNDIVEASRPVLERYRSGVGIAFELSTNLATARR